MAQLLMTPFDPQAELTQWMAGRTDVGALASFIGFVRGEDKSVTALRLDHYRGFTQIWLDDIEVGAKARFDVIDTLVIHRAGTLSPGEPIVLVGAIALHRKSALACVDYLMDCLKTDAPFWKQQIGPSGARWIEPRLQDHIDRENWNKTHD